MSDARAAAYRQFLDGKLKRHEATGRVLGTVPEILHHFQGDIVRTAARKGRFCIFADCGLGKTLMQAAWAREMRRPNARALFVAPLHVAGQTITEAREKLGMDIRYVTAPSDDAYQITNYERLQKFVGVPYDALTLDESSILKSIDGKTRTLILREFSRIPHRLANSATPAPNDIAELANHAEFVGAMSRQEMLAAFFVHDSDGKNAGEWRLKGHAQEEFWRWVASWAVYVRRPSDLGYDDGPFILPALNIREHVVETDYRPDGQLFAAASGLTETRDARRASIGPRVALVEALTRADNAQAIIWCELNDEGRAMAAALGSSAVLIEGATPEAEQAESLRRWLAGDVQTFIAKASMFGFGLNLQQCHRVFCLGLGPSYERYHQLIRRCWRFGQKHEVEVGIVTSEAETGVTASVRRKEADTARMAEGIVAHMKGAMLDERKDAAKAETYETQEATGEGWRLMLGDSVERIREVETGSVGLSVFSPPFASLYTYSASDRDMGNSKDYDQFFRHFEFLLPEMLRVTMPGRRACVHVQQVALKKAVDGVIGIRDFRADVVRAMSAAGWIYDGEVVIDKDPQAQAIRTKSKALMFVQKNKDSAWSRPAMADYILIFRAPGDNAEPVKTDVTNDEWIRWARPIWYGIRESETLNAAEARTDKDERHIAPLQLETIERCVRLWSNRGDLVASWFAGIGSEGYVSLQHGRRFVGVELKSEYWRAACRNLKAAQKQLGLFAEAAQ